MAVLQGDQGSVKFDPDPSDSTAKVAIVGTRSWTLNVTKETIDATSQSSGTFREFVGSFVSGSGTIELVYDNAQASQDTLFEDVRTSQDTADAAFELFTTGNADNTNNITFNGIITSFDISSTAGDLVIATCNFITSGSISFNL